MSDAAIRKFAAAMVTSYIVVAMIGAIGAWLFLAVNAYADTYPGLLLDDQGVAATLAFEVEVKETLIENLQWELDQQ